MVSFNKRHDMNFKIIFSFFCLALFSSVIATEKKVNGSASLWHKRYNEVSYAATHNGSSHVACPVQNQDMSLTKQFECGIRATKIHVWNNREDDGTAAPYVCHGVPKNIFEGAYLDKVVEKVPSLFQGWAREVLKQMEPINELVRDAFVAAYGTDEKPGAVQFNHCIFDPSRKKLTHVLQEVRDFLVAHRNEVVTLILEDHTRNLDQISRDFETAGLLPYVHTQDFSKPWPTLGHMVETNKRLVVLLHGDESLNYQQYPWLHHLWHYAWDTEWHFADVGSLKDESRDVVPKRGHQTFNHRHNDPKNKLFIMYHFVTPSTGGCKKSAKKVNQKNIILSRVDRLKKLTGCKPNIIQVDFFQYPNNDIFEVVNALNND